MNNNHEYWSSRPFKLRSNRVWRTYTGGSMIDEWQTLPDPHDTHLPEDWVASLVKARNPGRDHMEKEGLSLLKTSESDIFTLKDMIEGDPQAFLGKEHVQAFGANTGVLVKLLDSAERLTIQVHPDSKTAQYLFNSSFGKTEAWYVLGSREIAGEKPYVLFGFKPGITKDKWMEMFETQVLRA